MTNEPVFPNWIEDEYHNIRLMLPEGFDKKMDECRSMFELLQQELDKFEDSAKIYEIPDLSIEKIRPFFNDGNTALNFLCESRIGYFHYQHIYRIKGYFEGMINSMETGNWVSALTCLRCLMEEAVHFDYFLSRIEKQVEKIIKLYQDEGETLRQEKTPSEKWQHKLAECQIEVVRLAAKSIEGSNFNWEEYVETLSVIVEFDRDNPDIRMKNSDDGINIITCFQDSAKRHSMMFNEHYKVLSELCHPNFGSNTFVIKHTEEIRDNFGTVEFSHLAKTNDIARRFFQLCCDPIISTFSIEIDNMKKSLLYHALFRKCAEATPSMLNDLMKD